MAIDDNTSYELTGAQVKDLANRIKAKADDDAFVGATSAAPGSKGLVPQPQAGDDTKFLSGDGTWQTVQSGGSKRILTWDNGAMYNEDHNTISGGDIYTALQSSDVEVNDSESSSLIIENGIYASWTDPTYGTLSDVFFFTVEQTSYDGVMTRTQYLYDETNGWLTPNEMNIQKRLTSGSITKTYLDPDLQVKELVYEYSQTTTSSSTVTVDIPIDFGTYETYYFDVIGVGSDGSKEWGTIQALNGNKANLSTEQYGVEQTDSATLNGIARNYSQICACGWQRNQLTYIELTLRAVNANNYPWPCFKVMAQGAGRNQIFQGSVTTSAADVKYIRVNLVKPTGDGFTKVHAYATRRRS